MGTTSEGIFCSQSPPAAAANPNVCSVGFEQVAYDRCCSITSPTECEFLPNDPLPPMTPAPTITPSPTTSPTGGAPVLNLLSNPSFEDGLAGWDSFGPTQLTAVDSTSTEGSQSVLVTNRSAGWQGVSQNVLHVIITQPVGTSVTYDLSCWAKLPDGAGPSQNFKLTLRKTDDNGTSWTNIITGVGPGPTWTYLGGSISVTVVGTVTEATLYAEGPDGGVDFYLDDVSLVKK